MQAGQLLHQGQTDSSAFVRPGSSVRDAVEALEHAGKVGLRNADASVFNAQLDAIATRSEFDPNLSVESELEGVRQQIEEDLLPHLPIDVDGLGEGLAIDDELKPGFFNGRSEHAREFRGEAGEVGGLVVSIDAPGLDAREIQQRIHEPQQAQGIAMRHLLSFPMHGRQRRGRIGQAVFKRSDQQGERCSKFVTDVAEERRFCPIELRKGFGALSLLLVRARVGERRAKLVGDEIDKRAVRFVERAARIEADDQSAGVGGGREVPDQLGRGSRQLFLRAWRAALELIIEIREREGDILRLRGKCLHGEDAGVARGARRGIALGEVL